MKFLFESEDERDGIAQSLIGADICPQSHAVRAMVTLDGDCDDGKGDCNACWARALDEAGVIGNE